MEPLKQLSSLTGIPISPNGHCTAESRQVLQSTGLELKPATLWSIKCGNRRGLVVLDRFLARQRLLEDDAILKNTLYLKVLSEAVDLRKFQEKPGQSHRYQSAGFTESIGDAFNVHPQLIRYAIRAMRYDIIYEDLVSDQTEEPSWFTSEVRRYFSDYLTRGQRIRSDSIDKIAVNWSEEMENPIALFYRLLYQHMGGRTIGTWTSYEVESLLEFYRRQAASGNHLTFFDKDILESYRDGELDETAGIRIIKDTGLAYDNSAVSLHRNALLHSETCNPSDQRWVTRRG